MRSKRLCFRATIFLCLTALFLLYFQVNKYGDGTHIMTILIAPPLAAFPQKKLNTLQALLFQSSQSNEMTSTQPVRTTQSPATAVSVSLNVSEQVPQNTVQSPQIAVQTTQNAVQTTQNAVQTTQNAVQTTQNAVQTTQDAVQTIQNAVTSQTIRPIEPPTTASTSTSTKALPTSATTVVTKGPVPKLPPGIEHKPPDPLPCNWTIESLAATPQRRQGYLECSNGKPPTISFREVRSNVTPALWSLGQDDKACLKWFIRDQCLDRVEGQKIPRVAHVIRFGAFDLRLDGLLGLISVARIMKPCVILLHSDVMPAGPNLQALLQLVPYVLHVATERPRRIYDRVVNVVQHSADISRILILLEYGGVYLDMDYLIVNPLEDLYNESAVLGYELDNNACNGFLVAEANSRFMSLWLQNYTDFQDGQWATHSGGRSFEIAREHPEFVRLVRNFHNPHYAAISRYFSRSSTPKNYDYKKIYGLHLYSHRVYKKLFSSTRIDRQDNVIGDIVRYIIYNDEHACMKGTSYKRTQHTAYNQSRNSKKPSKRTS